MSLVAIFGPVPPGGTGRLPGLILIAIGLFGLLAIPFQLSKLSRRQVIISAILDCAAVLGGVLLFAHFR